MDRSRIRPFEPCQLTQDGRFSCARRPEQDDDRPLDRNDIERGFDDKPARKSLDGMDADLHLTLIHTDRCSAYVDVRIANDTSNNSSDVRDAAA